MAVPPDRIFLVHGVGPFDAKNIPQRVVAAFGPEWPVEVIPFNWDQEVARVFYPKSVIADLGALSEISAGLLNAANLGFLDDRPYAGISRTTLRIVNPVALVAQVFGWMTLLLLVPRSLLPCPVWLVWHACVAVFAGAMLLGALLSPSTAALIVSVRRVLLTALWPFAHCLATPLAFGLLALFLQAALLPAQLFFLHDWLDADIIDMWWLVPVYLIMRLAVAVATIGIGAALAVVIHGFVAGPLKVLGDIFRYIGEPAYATRLREGFVSEFGRATQGRTDIIILTHSLGSVIAVDCLRLYPQLTEKLQSVHLVTMGSPLKRLFAIPFPHIFAAPSDLFLELNNRIRNFNWTNVYRPLDYIGARLSPLSASGILERRVRQRLKLHVDYWGDPYVIRSIKQALKRQGTEVAAAPRPAAPGESIASSATRVTAVMAGPDDPSATRTDLGYPGRLRPIWAHRDWPLKALFAVVLLRLFFWFLSSVFMPSVRQIWSVSFDFGTVFLTATSCIGLMFVMFNIRRLWRNGIARYCDSLMGQLTAVPRPWGQPVTPPTPVVLRGWNRPAVVIPIAFALLTASTVHSIVVGARWHRLTGPMPVGPDVRSAAFLDSDHLALARPDGIEIFTLNNPRGSRRLLFRKDYGRDALVKLSSSGEWVAIIPGATAPGRSGPGPTGCVRLLRLPADPAATTVDEIDERCLEGRPDDAELDISNQGDLVVASRNSARVYLLGSRGTTELGSTGGGREVRRGARFTPQTDCLVLRGAKELLRYCSADRGARAMGTPSEEFEDFVAGNHLILIRQSQYSSPRLALLDEHGKLIAALDEASSSGDFDHPAIAMSGDEERVALVMWNHANVWVWRRRDYGESARSVFSAIAGVPIWKVLREHLSRPRAACAG